MHPEDVSIQITKAHLKLNSHEISLAHRLLLIFPFGSTWKLNCCVVCRISKLFDNKIGCYGRTRFHKFALAASNHFITVTSNDHQDILIYPPLDGLFNSLHRLKSKETPKLHNTGPLWKKSPSDQWIPLTTGPVMWKVFPFFNVIM